MPTPTILRGLACLLIALAVGCAASQGGGPAVIGPSDADVQALIDDLNGEITELETMGMDVKQLEQHARMARVQLDAGENAYAEELAAKGLELADGVRGRVDEIIAADLEERDRNIRIAVAALEDYLREGWETGADLRLAEVDQMVASRDERASHTGGRYPSLAEEDKVTTAKIAQIRKVIADIAESQVKSEFTDYKTTLGRPLVKLRGNESLELQEAMRFHVEDQAYKAKKSYLAALREQPDDYKTLQNLGILQLELGEYGEAVARLQKAFDIGLTLDETDGEWYRDFVPNPDPLIAALGAVGKPGAEATVRGRYAARVEEVDRMKEEREQARIAALTEPEEVVEVSEESEQASEDEKCRQKPVAGKVQMIADGMDMETVREIICAPDSLKLVDNRAYWYYQTGTVIFEDEKVLETSQQRVEPEG